MKRDPIEYEVELAKVEKLAYLAGEWSAAAAALKWADERGGRKSARYFRTRRGTLVAVMDEGAMQSTKVAG